MQTTEAGSSSSTESDITNRLNELLPPPSLQVRTEYNVATGNRFDALTQEDAMDITENSPRIDQPTQLMKLKREPKPPPLVMHNRSQKPLA